MIMRCLFIITLGALFTGVLSQGGPHTCEITIKKPWIPYMGIRVQRDFSVKGKMLPLLKFVTMSHCQSGNLDTERMTRTETQADVDWDKPICFLGQNKIIEDRESQMSNLKMANQFRDLTFGDLPKLPHARNIVAKPPQILQPRALKDRPEDSVKKRSDGTLVDNSKDSLVIKSEDLEVISYRNMTPDYLDELRCYKMARRKKYFQREMIMYAPQTWVGGLFECQVSNEDKARYLTSLKKSNEFSKPFEIRCGSSNATPVLPLIADDSSSAHFEVDGGVLTQLRIPYLLTLGSSSDRLKMTASRPEFEANHHVDKELVNHESSDPLPYDTWFEEIEVNENYNFLPKDRVSLSQIIEQSTALLLEFLELNCKMNQWDWDQESLFGTEEVQSLDYMELKLWYMLFKNNQREVALQFLKAIQQPWDDLQLSSETFSYQLSAEL